MLLVLFFCGCRVLGSTAVFLAGDAPDTFVPDNVKVNPKGVETIITAPQPETLPNIPYVKKSNITIAWCDENSHKYPYFVQSNGNRVLSAQFYLIDAVKMCESNHNCTLIAQQGNYMFFLYTNEDITKSPKISTPPILIRRMWIPCPDIDYPEPVSKPLTNMDFMLQSSIDNEGQLQQQCCGVEHSVDGDLNTVARSEVQLNPWLSYTLNVSRWNTVSTVDVSFLDRQAMIRVVRDLQVIVEVFQENRNAPPMPLYRSCSRNHIHNATVRYVCGYEGVVTVFVRLQVLTEAALEVAEVIISAGPHSNGSSSYSIEHPKEVDQSKRKPQWYRLNLNNLRQDPQMDVDTVTMTLNQRLQQHVLYITEYSAQDLEDLYGSESLAPGDRSIEINLAGEKLHINTNISGHTTAPAADVIYSTCGKFNFTTRINEKEEEEEKEEEKEGERDRRHRWGIHLSYDYLTIMRDGKLLIRVDLRHQCTEQGWQERMGFKTRQVILTNHFYNFDARIFAFLFIPWTDLRKRTNSRCYLIEKQIKARCHSLPEESASLIFDNVIAEFNRSFERQVLVQKIKEREITVAREKLNWTAIYDEHYQRYRESAEGREYAIHAKETYLKEDFEMEKLARDKEVLTLMFDQSYFLHKIFSIIFEDTAEKLREDEAVSAEGLIFNLTNLTYTLFNMHDNKVPETLAVKPPYPGSVADDIIGDGEIEDFADNNWKMVEPADPVEDEREEGEEEEGMPFPYSLYDDATRFINHYLFNE